MTQVKSTTIFCTMYRLVCDDVILIEWCDILAVEEMTQDQAKSITIFYTMKMYIIMMVFL